MGSDELLLIAMAMGTMAGLFSTVGHGGGSGYLAVMAVASVAPETMRPMALSLNLAVAAIATWRFGRTGTFRSDLFGPLIAVSVPAAFLGGLLEVPGTIYRPLVGAVLVIAAVRLLLPTSAPPRQKVQMRWLIAAGIVIGVASGIIGVGGGIFLSPLVLLAGWATPKEAAAITAPFILINSAAGLLGITVAHASYPVGLSVLWPPLLAVLCGGFLGSWIGTHHLGGLGLRRILSVVLICAGIKMFLPLKVAPERTQERAQVRAQERA
jgi:uncharacterized membrane protein YfcA